MSAASSSPSPALQDAFRLLRQNRLQESAAAFRRILAMHPGNAEALHGLSRAQMSLGHADEAIATARTAVAAAPDNPALHYALGIMLDDAKALDGAVQAYSAAVRLKPDFVQAWNNLGSALFDLGRRTEAIQCLNNATTLETGAPAYHANLGRMLLASGQPEAAAMQFGTALTLEERAAGGRSANYPLYAKLGEALEQACAEKLAMPAVDVAGTIDLLRRLAQHSALVDHAERAMALNEKIVSLDPTNWPSRFARKRILPAIAASAGAMKAARRRYAEGLDQLLIDVADATIRRDRDQIVAAARSDSIFHLAYQGENDRPLQEQLSAIWNSLLASIVPDCQQPIVRQEHGRPRLRVGFVGSHFRQSTIGRYFASWIMELDRERFETHVYMIDQPATDALTAAISSRVHKCVNLTGGFCEIARDIRSENLDAVIFPELGMDMPTFVLASLRLAPVQCAAWGHPVTSGHANVDYFFSSEWAEPADGQTHYTESLVLLPGLGTRYAAESPAEGLTRADFGLPTTGPLFFFPHSLFKIHPDCDDLIARVLAAAPDSHLVTISRENPWLTNAFMARLHDALKRHGAEKAQVLLLKGMPHDRFLALAGLCNAMLDTLHWSGGNTTLDVLTVGLPVVALPGQFMRGRQSAGILSAMGLTELIADTPEAFIRIAYRLAKDPAWRQECSRRIRAGHALLFDDRRPINALEQFLIAATAPGPKMAEPRLR
jgi:CRISPR-associated protein Csy1